MQEHGDTLLKDQLGMSPSTHTDIERKDCLETDALPTAAATEHLKTYVTLCG